MRYDECVNTEINLSPHSSPVLVIALPTFGGGSTAFLEVVSQVGHFLLAIKLSASFSMKKTY